MTSVLSIYHEASGLTGQLSEYVLSIVVNSVGNMVSSFSTPLLVCVFLLSLCRWTDIELFV